MVKIKIQQKSSKPKRPLNPYFKMRLDMLKILPIEYKKSSIIDQEWKNMDPRKKAEMNEEYQKELRQYRLEIRSWAQRNEMNSSIKSDLKMANDIQKSQNSENSHSYISGASRVHSLIRNVIDDRGVSESFPQIKDSESFQSEVSYDRAIQNHLRGIKHLIKKKQQRWRKQRKRLHNKIRIERQKSKNFKQQYSKATVSLQSILEHHSKSLQRQ